MTPVSGGGEDDGPPRTPRRQQAPAEAQQEFTTEDACRDHVISTLFRPFSTSLGLLLPGTLLVLLGREELVVIEELFQLDQPKLIACYSMKSLIGFIELHSCQLTSQPLWRFTAMLLRSS